MSRVNYDSGTLKGPKALTQRQSKPPQVAAPSNSYKEQFWWLKESDQPYQITELIPQAAPAGGPNFILRVRGFGFTETSEIIWNGGAEPTVFVSPTEIQTNVQAMTASMPGAIEVKVTTDLETTNALTFNFT